MAAERTECSDATLALAQRTAWRLPRFLQEPRSAFHGQRGSVFRPPRYRPRQVPLWRFRRSDGDTQTSGQAGVGHSTRVLEHTLSLVPLVHAKPSAWFLSRRGGASLSLACWLERAGPGD